MVDGWKTNFLSFFGEGSFVSGYVKLQVGAFGGLKWIIWI